MSVTEETLGASPTSTEFESNVVVITVPSDYKGIVSPQRSFSHFSQHFTSISEVKNSLHGSDTSLGDEMQIQKAPSSDPPTFETDSLNPKKAHTIF